MFAEGERECIITEEDQRRENIKIICLESPHTAEAEGSLIAGNEGCHESH